MTIGIKPVFYIGESPMIMGIIGRRIADFVLTSPQILASYDLRGIVIKSVTFSITDGTYMYSLLFHSPGRVSGQILCYQQSSYCLYI